MNQDSLWKRHKTLALLEGLHSVSKPLFIIKKSTGFQIKHKRNPLLSWSPKLAKPPAFHLFRHQGEIPHWIQTAILTFYFPIGTRINWITLSEKSQLCEFTSLSQSLDLTNNEKMLHENDSKIIFIPDRKTLLLFCKRLLFMQDGTFK